MGLYYLLFYLLVTASIEVLEMFLKMQYRHNNYYFGGFTMNKEKYEHEKSFIANLRRECTQQHILEYVNSYEKNAFTKEQMEELKQIAKEAPLTMMFGHYLVPVKPYGSEGLIPKYDECNISCISSSGGSCCRYFEGKLGDHHTMCSKYVSL